MGSKKDYYSDKNVDPFRTFGFRGELSMLSVKESYERLIMRFCEWAKDREDVRALLVIGSRARVDHPADAWADLDLVVVTRKPEFYLSTTDWINALGKPLLTIIEPTATADEKERRVLFEDMLDVDFAIIPSEKAKELLHAAESPKGIRQMSNVLGRGTRILLDKDEVISKLKAAAVTVEKQAPNKPTEQEFQGIVNDFLYHAVFTAKHLRRGELWWTVLCLNCRLQNLMKTMIEWHSLAKSDGKQDTWFRGRFLEEWAQPGVTDELRKSFAHYDKEDTQKALNASITLFTRIANETAQKLGYHYPTDTELKIKAWIEKTLR